MRQIKDYLHLYLGCQFITPNSQGELNATTLPLVINMCKRGDKVQLLLIPLSAMTEQEAQELNSIGGGTEVFQKGSIVYSFDSDRILWALKRRFDLFGLIESELAIYRTNQPTIS